MTDFDPDLLTTVENRMLGAIDSVGDDLVDWYEPFQAIMSDSDDESPADELIALAVSRVAVQNFSPIREMMDMVREYLEVHNSPEALNGYMNDLAQDINPILVKLDIAPITIVPDDDLSTD